MVFSEARSCWTQHPLDCPDSQQICIRICRWCSVVKPTENMTDPNWSHDLTTFSNPSQWNDWLPWVFRYAQVRYHVKWNLMVAPNPSLYER